MLLGNEENGNCADVAFEAEFVVDDTLDPLQRRLVVAAVAAAAAAAAAEAAAAAAAAERGLFKELERWGGSDADNGMCPDEAAKEGFI